MPRFGKVSRLAPVALLLAPAALGGCTEAWVTRPVRTSVHELNGQRVDVPQHDLAPDGSGLLRNGVTPQPQQFD